MRRAAFWILAGIMTILVTVLAFLPASYLSARVETASNGRLTFLNTEGTLWRGSATLAALSHTKAAPAPLVPGKISWKLSPLALIGRVQLTLENPDVFIKPVHINGSWSEWQLTAAAMNLPADSLTGLGAPLNTLGLRGKIRLSWPSLKITRSTTGLEVDGITQLEMNDMESRLYPGKPLGSYQMHANSRGQQTLLSLETIKGPLRLHGAGEIVNGHFRFSGTAEADEGHAGELTNLLMLLGQPKNNTEGRTVIGLEFK